MLDRFGFVSTRFAGTDGVSLESAKWADVLRDEGHGVAWYGGRLQCGDEPTMCVPEAHFDHPENRWISDHLWCAGTRPEVVADRVSHRVLSLARYLKETLYEFVRVHDLTALVVENALSIPMHVPLGLAITDFLAETHLPCIAHHHDFFWERDRFLTGAADYLDTAFPPRNPCLRHVVINQAAGDELGRRRDVSAVLIPNVLDYDHGPGQADEYCADMRRELGLTAEDVFILQPTRVVPRKGIEHAIELVKVLGDPANKIVVSHDAGDEGLSYQHSLQELAARSAVDLRFVSERISDTRGEDARGRKTYSLWDLYLGADFVTYPSLCEGFGNALLEAVYFRLPLLVNRYPVYARDIEPLGFRFVTMDGALTPENVQEVRRLLGNPAYRGEVVDHNYSLARKHFDYSLLRRRLRRLVASLDRR